MTQEISDKIVIKGRGTIKKQTVYKGKFRDTHLAGNYEIPNIHIKIAKEALKAGYKYKDKLEYTIIIEKKK